VPVEVVCMMRPEGLGVSQGVGLHFVLDGVVGCYDGLWAEGLDEGCDGTMVRCSVDANGLHNKSTDACTGCCQGLAHPKP
jgi:hypothetical protein